MAAAHLQPELGRPELGREYPPPDEAADIAQVLAIMRGQFEHTFPLGCPGPIRRDQHPKAHGCVRAVFTVEDGLPGELRHGLFRTPQSYDAWIRFSPSSPQMPPDTKRDAHGMAIKLLGVPGLKVLDGEQDAQTQDFLMANNDAFFVRSTRDYVQFAQAFASDRVMSFFFGLNPLRCRLRELTNMLLSVGKQITNPLQTRYWSQTPYRLGPHAVKYSARPLSAAQDALPDAPGPDYSAGGDGGDTGEGRGRVRVHGAGADGRSADAGRGPDRRLERARVALPPRRHPPYPDSGVRHARAARVRREPVVQPLALPTGPPPAGQHEPHPPSALRPDLQSPQRPQRSPARGTGGGGTGGAMMKAAQTGYQRGLETVTGRQKQKPPPHYEAAAFC